MICYGIDIGTTTIRMMVSEVRFEPGRERTVNVLSKNPLCLFTPFETSLTLNIPAILHMIKAYVEREQFPPPDTGTILYTGEAQRTTNLSECTKSLSALWPNLFSAQLSPEIESRLAAFGAGATQYSKLHPGKSIIHLDIGGGTTNLARIENGEIVDTACLDLGCRKWIMDPATQKIIHRTPCAEILETKLFPEIAPILLFNIDIAKIFATHIAELLFQYCRNVNKSHSPFVVIPWSQTTPINRNVILSLSGGIADCPQNDSSDPFCYGDLGPLLLYSIKNKMESENQEFLIAPGTGRATVLGVSAHSFQLAGSSIYYSPGFPFPQRNIPLIEQNAFNSAKITNPQSILAIYVRSLNQPTLENITALVEHFISDLKASKFAASLNIAFLLQPNIAQTFGYLFQKALPPQFKIEFCVLDEITLPTKNIGLQLLDISKDGESKRLLLRILEFARF